MKKRMVMAATATLVVGLSASVTAASAADWLYYSNVTKVGRVQVDGTNRDDNFASFDNKNVTGLAATDSAVYVVRKENQISNDKTLWKVDASGTKTQLLGGSLMCSTTGASPAPYVHGLATDGQYLYYICENGLNPSSTFRKLARVSLDGTAYDETFSGDLTGIYVNSFDITAGGGYAYFVGGPSSGNGVTGVYRVALTAGATATRGSNVDLGAMAWSPAGLFWTSIGGTPKSLGRFPVADFPSWTSTSVFSPITPSLSTPALAVKDTNVFWVSDAGQFPGQASPTIAKGNADGSGTPDTSFLSFRGFAMLGYLAVGSGPGGDTPAPAPTPGTTPGTTPAATVLSAPTQSSTADSNGNVAVSLSLQLDEVGKYTFIFEKVTSNEMSREQASGSSRISMQKGTKIGKRKLTKTVTAADVTTTSAGAKVVMRALLKKAQAKKWNLRVIHAANDGTLTQSVIKK